MRVARNQNAIYWAPTVADAYGRMALAAPVQITCRWEDNMELFINMEGQEVRSAAVVYPSQAVLTEGFLCQGLVADLPSDDSPESAGALKIQATQCSPGVRSSATLLKVWLL